MCKSAIQEILAHLSPCHILHIALPAFVHFFHSALARTLGFQVIGEEDAVMVSRMCPQESILPLWRNQLILWV